MTTTTTTTKKTTTTIGDNSSLPVCNYLVSNDRRHTDNQNNLSNDKHVSKRHNYSHGHSSLALYFALLLLLLIQWANFGHALKCYTCSSADDPSCGMGLDPATNHTAIDCNDDPHIKEANAPAKVCRKLVQHAESRQVVTRTCGWIDETPTSSPGHQASVSTPDNKATTTTTDNKQQHPHDACVKRSGTFAVMVESCTCYTDGCNGAESIMGAHWSLFNCCLLALALTLVTIGHHRFI